MMGDRNYKEAIRGAVESIGRELEIKIDATDIETIHLSEVVWCLRRSYFDRVEPVEARREGFSELLSGLLRKLHYGSEAKDFDVGGIKLRCQADMILDDAIILFRSAQAPPRDPNATDLLYLNACMWAYDKTDGIVVYVTGDRQETSFSLTRNKKMFEEVARRIRVLHDLLESKKRIPILEPSEGCSSCQYYHRCYIRERISKPISIMGLVGMGDR